MTRLTKAIIDDQFTVTRKKLLELNPEATKLNYTLDLGNTNPHCGKFTQGRLTSVTALNEPKVLQEFIEKTPNWVASNVTHFSISPEHQLSHLRRGSRFLEMDIKYAEGLGEDRLFQSYFLHHNFPDEEILFIDAGTFITIDLISKEGFQGGYIFPGIQTFLNSYTNGQKLPKLTSTCLSIQQELPHCTQEAIEMALNIYLRTTLDFFIQKYSHRMIILTGGTGSLISKEFSLENYYPHLIHESLFHLKHYK